MNGRSSIVRAGGFQRSRRKHIARRRRTAISGLPVGSAGAGVEVGKDAAVEICTTPRAHARLSGGGAL
jgi:hypothetical protein